MELIELKCPNCGSKLKITFNGQKIVICEYCGSTFYLGVDNGDIVIEEETCLSVQEERLPHDNTYVDYEAIVSASKWEE